MRSAPIDMTCPVNWQHPLCRGLLAWYRYVPGVAGGPRLMNLVRPDNIAKHGSLTNSPVWQGRTYPGGDGSLNFTAASSQWVDCGQVFQANAVNATIAGWMYRATTTVMVVFGNMTLASRFNILRFTDGNIYWQGSRTDGNGYAWVANNTTGWIHVAFAYNGNLVGYEKFAPYINGVRRTFAGTGLALAGDLGAADTLAIGREVASSRYSTGNLDDVMCFNRTLSDFDVGLLYQESLQGYPGILHRPKMRSYSLPSGPTFQPAWASRSSQVIGGGVV